MKEPDDQTQLASEVHIFETPEDMPQTNQVAPLKVQATFANNSLLQVQPPRRDNKKSGKSEKNDRPRLSFARQFGIFTIACTLVLSLSVLLNLSYLEGLFYSAKGIMDTKNNDLASAVQNYERAYNANPNDVNPLLLAASIHLAKKENDLAFKEFDTAIKKLPNPTFAYHNRAKVLVGQGRTAEAIEDWKKALKFTPTHKPSLARQALAYISLNNYSAAILDLDKLIKLEPNDTFGLSNKAYCLSQLRRYQDAITTINGAIAIDPSDGHLKEQKRYFERQVGVDSTN